MTPERKETLREWAGLKNIVISIEEAIDLLDEIDQLRGVLEAVKDNCDGLESQGLESIPIFVVRALLPDIEGESKQQESEG